MTSLVLLTALITSGQAPIPEPINFLKVDAGFKIQRFTNDAQTPDVYCISFGPKGQLLVSGKNYLRIVQDSNQDGVPDHFEDIPIRWSDAPTGHCWDENKIWFTGNQGLWVVQLNDDYKITSSRKVLEFKTGGEHEAHAVRKGPDGNIYVLCGNNTGIQAKHATHPHSPIKNPVAGTLLRYHPKIEKCEILVDGLRNPYGFDFNLEGEIFTYDSDNERCISLPWYEGTRLYHLIPFGRYGWWNPQRADTWRSPPWHADIQKPISNLGRGSPTGVACCLSTKFSSSMVGSMFIADWTFGKIWHCPLQRNGSSYLSKPSAFIEPCNHQKQRLCLFHRGDFPWPFAQFVLQQAVLVDLLLARPVCSWQECLPWRDVFPQWPYPKNLPRGSLVNPWVKQIHQSSLPRRLPHALFLCRPRPENPGACWLQTVYQLPDWLQKIPALFALEEDHFH